MNRTGGDRPPEPTGPPSATTDAATDAEAPGAAPVSDVRIVVDADPRRAARRLAAELGAEIVEGSVAAEDLVRRRLSGAAPSAADVDEAVRLSGWLEGFDAEEDRDRAEPVPHVGAAVGHRPPTGEDLARLRRLDDELAVLDQVRQRTEARATQGVAADLAGRTLADIAGDTDPQDVEQWPGARAGGPGLSAGVVTATSAVRAARAAHRRTRATWRVTWADLGREPPEPQSEESAVALRNLADEVQAAEAEPASAVAEKEAAGAAERAKTEEELARVQARQRLAALLGSRSLAQLRAAASEAVDEPIVVLMEPFAELGTRRAAVLRRQLRELRHLDRVVVVVADPARVPPP